MYDFLVILAHANIAAGASILFVLILRKPVRWRFGARAAYHLWTAAPIAALACTLPPLPANVAPTMNLGSASAQVAFAWRDAMPPSADLPLLVFVLWSLGVTAGLCIVAARQWRFTRLASAGSAGPAVLGVFFPKVVIPADFEAKYTSDERRLILAHERSHVIRHDALINGVITLAQCASWFNPLVHLAAFYARLDQELACDDDVMRRFPDDRRTYAEAMLKSHLATAPAPLGCQWPSRSIHPLEERIAMLSKPRPGKLWRLAGAALVAALCLATAYVASAREGAQQSAPAAGAASTGLSMRWVDESEGAANRAGNQRVAAPEGDLWLEPGAVMTGDMIASAATMTGSDGNVVVGFQLTQEGKGRFAALTRANIGRRLAILVNGTLVSAPVIRSEISEGAGQISGRWETAEAEALAAAIAPKRESR